MGHWVAAERVGKRRCHPRGDRLPGACRPLPSTPSHAHTAQGGPPSSPPDTHESTFLRQKPHFCPSAPPPPPPGRSLTILMKYHTQHHIFPLPVPLLQGKTTLPSPPIFSHITIRQDGGIKIGGIYSDNIPSPRPPHRIHQFIFIRTFLQLPSYINLFPPCSLNSYLDI